MLEEMDDMEDDDEMECDCETEKVCCTRKEKKMGKTKNGCEIIESNPT